mgnify:CR=1 FL=1
MPALHAARLDRAPQKFLVDHPEDWGVFPGVGYVLLLAPLLALRWRRDLLLPYLWLVCTIGAVAALDVLAGRATEIEREVPPRRAPLMTHVIVQLGLVLCSLGDGSVTEGEVAEALQMAVLKKLPILYLVQDNDWGISATGKEMRAMDAYEYAGGFKGLERMAVDGADFIDNLCDHFRYHVRNHGGGHKPHNGRKEGKVAI